MVIVVKNSYHYICGDTMKLKTILGKNVKYHRYRKRLTQERLAEILNVSPNYVGRLERGQHSPSLEKIEMISKALDIKAFELFVERDDYNNIPDRVNLTNPKK